MNNCIGARYLGSFYIFILILWINIIVGLFLCCSVFASTKDQNDGDDIPLIGSDIISAVCAIVELLMFLPVSYLLWTHSNNFWLGLTTNERQSSNNKKEKNSNGCFKNCTSMFCNTETNEENLTRVSTMTSDPNPLEVSLQEAK